MEQLNIALVGLGFGGSFLPIYLDHPKVKHVGIFDSNREVMEHWHNRHPQVKLYNSFEDILADKSIDAVHLVTPIPCHAEQSIAVLESGKHCACTVPMATSLKDIQRIVDAKRKSEKNYMMMETTLYTHHFFYVKEMINNGELGRIQFMRGSHYQDMSNWPDYWLGLPPMWYGTHAIAPMVALSQSRITRVCCFGSGTMDEKLHKQYNNPYPIESALFEFENGLKGEATRSLFETARTYQEGMFVYGSKASFEWAFHERQNPYVTTLEPHKDKRRGALTPFNQIELPNFYHLLPPSIQKYTCPAEAFDPENPHLSLSKAQHGAGHHGSHPHLVHEFVMSIVENRKPWIDEILGGNITAAGVCAHESAMKNGEFIAVPEF